MTDVWSLLLQTITATAAAGVILLIKRIFRDKLTPLWQFSVWSVLGAVLFIPAGISGHSVFFNWMNITEFLKTYFLGEYTLSRVYAFFPLIPTKTPENIFDILFIVYFAGVLFFLIKYTVSYIRLRLALRKAKELTKEELSYIKETAEEYSLPLCRCVKSEGISSPFICGIFSPVLVLPDKKTDKKIILHELLHLKHKDVLWGIIISVFRSIHWCNPLLWFVFNKINNDIEELCDSRVLELLQGEERRDYGNILLSMVNEKFACMPGTSSVSNGGKNITSRIKTIVRFKKYPVPSSLVNVCIIILIGTFILLGNSTLTIKTNNDLGLTANVTDYMMASARALRCYTPAGAIDTYTKAVLQSDGILRACTAPISEHEKIAEELNENRRNGVFPLWDSSLDETPVSEYTYNVYNYKQTEKNTYSAFIGFEIRCNNKKGNEKYIAFQEIEIKKEDGRWIVNPLGEFQKVLTNTMVFGNACNSLPTYCYKGETEDFLIEKHYQHILSVDSLVKTDEKLPRLHAYFNYMWVYDFAKITYIGDEKDSITHMRYGFKEIDENDGFPEISSFGGGSTDFSVENEKLCGGGGFGGEYNEKDMKLPDRVACEFNINREPYRQLILIREEN